VALAIAAGLEGQPTTPPPVRVVVLTDCVNKSSVPAASVPTGALIAWLATLEMATLAATATVPRVVTVMAQEVAQLVALGEILNVLEPAAHTYVGTLTRVAALVGQSTPDIDSVLPLVEK